MHVPEGREVGMIAGAKRKPPVRQAAKASIKKTSLGAGSTFTKNDEIRTMLTSAALTFAAVRPGRAGAAEVKVAVMVSMRSWC